MDEYENLEEIIENIFEYGYDTRFEGYERQISQDDIEGYAESIKEILKKEN